MVWPKGVLFGGKIGNLGEGPFCAQRAARRYSGGQSKKER